VILALFLAGCEHDCFEVEIRPEGEGFQRKLTCWHVGGKDDQEIQPLRPEELARIGKLYTKWESPEGAKKRIFSGRFAESTPADVGGAGVYTHFTSPLGSTTCYVERFRGDDNLQAQLSQRRRSADQLTGLVLGWLAAELGHDPGFPGLKKFLDEDLRRDLKNLGVYEWTGNAMSDYQPESNGEYLFRAGLYLCERGYFSPKELPALARSLMADDYRPLLIHVERLLARKMGVADDQPIPASLAFLGDLPKLRASLEKYVRSTELFQKRVAQWKAANKNKSQTAEPTPESVAGELLSGAFGRPESQILGGQGDALDVKLFCPQKPYASNGKWDAKAAAVTWTKPLSPDRVLPVLCFASWSTPDRTFQEKHFGRVLLSDGGLAQYAVWYRLLKPEEMKEWDRFMNGLAPGPGLIAAVKEFRFSTEPKLGPHKAKEPPTSLADLPRRLILEPLEAK
jgi:hypothetical protein